MKTELLAPAKNIEIAKAAIDAGADAVYIGASAYGARQRACNSIEDIKELVEYAHKFYVKVMVTVNTIIKNSELEDVKTLIKSLCEIGVDALIVQDMAIIKWAIEGDIPLIPLHISTQCNNRTKEKVRFFSDVGVPRIVLARELPLEEIKDIIEYNPDIEIETFAHGALCVSYSGQCYMSQYIGGRSANRGECAQPCRKKYTVIDDEGNVLIDNKHALCLKDFNTSRYIEDLVNIGIKSFKIEGRLKDVEYVKNVVGYYRKLLDKCSEKESSGTVELGFTPDLNKTFNRGYTTYFLKGREKCFNMDSPKFIGEKIGTVGAIYKNKFKINLTRGVTLNNQDGLCFDNKGEIGCLINKVENDMVYPNNKPNIEVGMDVYRNIDSVFEKSLGSAKTKRRIRANIIYNNFVISAIDEDKNEVSMNIIERELPKNIEKLNFNFLNSMKKSGESDFLIENVSIESKLPFMSISTMNEYRRMLLDKLMQERINNYKNVPAKPLKYAKYPEVELDYRANVYNRESEAFYNNCGAKVIEYAFEKEEPKREIELMRTKHCIKYALNMCKSPKNLRLVDEKGEKFKLKFDCKNCEMAVVK